MPEFVEAKSYSGVPIVAPPTALGYETHVRISRANMLKYERTMEWVRSYGVGSVVELFAGFGAMTVEYKAAGCDVALAVEGDKARFEALKVNVGEPPALFADNTRLHQVERFDADFIDLDPYNDPWRCFVANRNKFVRGQLVAFTVVPIAWRFHNPRVSKSTGRHKVAGEFARKFGAERVSRFIARGGANGKGFSHYVVAPWVCEVFPGTEVLDWTTEGSSTERVLIRIGGRSR